MTLISTIITDAYRETNMLALGKVPAENQLTEALRLYNQVLAALYGGDVGERLVDWPLGGYGREPNAETMPATHHPRPNSRLIATNEEPRTVYMPWAAQDGARYGIADPFGRLAVVPVTLDGNGRTIENVATLTLNTAGLFREWIYRADLASWLRVANVELADENPFPANFDAMFTILLAMRLNPRYGRMLDEQSVAVLRQGKREFIARYVQSAVLETDDSISWPFLSTQSYNNGASFGSTAAFNRGDTRGV